MNTSEGKISENKSKNVYTALQKAKTIWWIEREGLIYVCLIGWSEKIWERI